MKKFTVENIRKCGFCFDSSLIWFLTEEYEEDEEAKQKIYKHSFKLFCIEDLKIIFNVPLHERFIDYHIKDVIFDPTDNT